MQLLLIIVALMTVAGLVVMIVSLRKTPMGYEDQEGFHAMVSDEDGDDSSRRAPRRPASTEEGGEHLDDTAPHAA